LAFGSLEHLGNFVTFDVHRGKRLERLVCFLVELVAVAHVIAHDTVQSYMPLLHELFHQVIQLSVL